jgi:hypothetical protein
MPDKIQLKNVLKLWRNLLVLAMALVCISAWASTNETLEQLRVDYAALQSAEADYRNQRELNGLDGAEAEDYATYVAGLQRRVFEDCRDLMLSGSPTPEDLPCPVIVPPVTQSADISTESEQTPEEQIAALDSLLNAGLGEYDEKLLREQERIKAQSPNNNSAGGGGGAGGSGDGSEGDGSEGQGSEGQGSEGQSSEGESSEGESESEGQSSEGSAGDTRQGEGASGQQQGGPVDSSSGSTPDGNESDRPSDIPDGSNDDVVARQLREAAENETDPELKAKLWEEYRRYKRGTN